MKNVVKLFIVSIFVATAIVTLLVRGDLSGNTSVLAQTANKAVTPTPAPATAPGGKSIPKNFVLGKDSASEHGEVTFDHDTHASKNYSVDGKSVIGCVECHHTDQPKSALKLPLVTSERDVVLTMDVWKGSTKKVSECRTCHFQDGNVPDGKTMPTVSATVAGKSTSKDLNNELAYHINCNTCHDAAAKLRPELKGKKSGFAIGNDCFTCHKQN
ncbi:MAG: cytochrome c3 family protein [Pyrinomonadaceae bacterium]